MSEFKLSIRGDLKDLTNHLTRLQRKSIPFASALALTRTAQSVRTDLYRTMLKIFDEPVAYTVPKNIKEPKQKGSLYLVPATKKKLESQVYIKNLRFGKGTPAYFYLAPHIESGDRKPKGSEQSLRGKGVIGGGKYLAPSTRSPYGHINLNRHGNVTKGTMNKVLSGLHSLRGLPAGSRSRQKSTYFAMPKKGGGTATGIWERRGKRLKKLFNVVDTPRYRKRLYFGEIGEASARKHFNRNFQKALREALATQR